MADNRTITILGVEVPIPQPYDAGHPLTEVEAKSLNQTVAENIGNNLRSKIKKAKEDNNVEAKMQEFIDYANAYELTVVTRGSSITLSPEDREARKIARQLIGEHIRATGRRVKDVDKEAMEGEIARVAETEPVRKLAKKRVKEMESIVSEKLPEIAA